MSKAGRPRRVALGRLAELGPESRLMRSPLADFPVWIVAGGRLPVDVFASIPETTDDPLEAEGIFENLRRFVAANRVALTDRIGPSPRAAFHFDASVEAVRAVFEGAGFEVMGIAEATATLPGTGEPRKRAARVAPPKSRRRSFYLYEAPLDDDHVALAFVDEAAWRAFLEDVHGTEELLEDPDDIAELTAPRAKEDDARLWVVQEGVVREEVDLAALLCVAVDGVEVPLAERAQRLAAVPRLTWWLDVDRVRLPPLVGKRLTEADGVVPFVWGIPHEGTRLSPRCALGAIQDDEAP